MALRINVSGSGSVTVRIDRATRIEVDAVGGVRIELVDCAAGTSALRRLRKRDGRDAMAAARRGMGGPTVTATMEAAAVEAFLAGADLTRLGRSLSDVYSAMEAVRRLECGRDDGS